MDAEQPGPDLATVLAAEGPMEPARAVAIVGRVAPLLDSAAAEGVVRTVTPADVRLVGDDVGLSAAADDVATDGAAGDRPDVPALAGVLFACLTGRLPVTGTPTPPSAVRAEVPPELDDVVLRGLESGYPTSGELADAAAAALPAAVGTAPDPADRADSGAAAHRAGRLPVLLGAVAVLAVLAIVLFVVLFVVLSGGSDDDPAEPAAADDPMSQPTDPPTAADDTDDPVQAQVRSSIPADWIPVDCDHGELPDDGAVAALGCGAASTQPGPEDSVFYRYADAAALDAVFLADMERNGVPPLPAGAACPVVYGHGTYEVDGEPAGRIGCYVDGDNDAILIWTRDAVATEALVTVMDGGQVGLEVLYDWWSQRELSDFIQP